MSHRSPWSVLRIAPSRDRAEIRRAYAAALKLTNPEDDAEGFQRLREAYDAALAMARQAEWRDSIRDREDEDEDGGEVAEAVTPEPRPETSHASPEGASDGERPPRPAEAIPPAPPPEPPPPDPRRLALDALNADCRRLADLVCSDGPSNVAEVRRLGEAILRSPALEEVDVHHRVEIWMLDLIASNVPRGDALIALAEPCFRWEAQASGLNVSHALRFVLARAEDVRFANAMLRTSHGFHRAYRALTRPPSANPVIRWFRTLRDAAGVRAFLNKLDERPNTLHLDFDPAAQAWWQKWSSQPRLGVGSWLTILILPVVLLPGLLSGVSPVIPPGMPVMFVYLIGLAGVGSVVAGRHYALAVLPDLWRTRWRFNAPELAAWGWLPMGILAVVMAGLLPPWPPSTAILLAVSAVVVLWAFVVGEPSSPGNPAERLIQLSLDNLFLAVSLLIMLRGELARHGLLLAVLALIAGTFSHHRLALEAYIRGQPRPWRLQALAATALSAAGCAVLLFAAGSLGWMQSATAGALAATYIFHRLQAVKDGVVAQRVRIGAHVLGFAAVYFTAFDQQSASVGATPFAMAGVMLLCPLIASLGLTALRELAPPRPFRRNLFG